MDSKSRARRIRAKLGSGRPRLSVFVSAAHIYAQIIDDAKGNTLIAVADSQVGKAGKNKQTAREVGLLLAKKAKAKKIIKVVLDRGSRKYHGRVAALAQAAREGGLIF